MHATKTQERLEELLSSHPTYSDHERHDVANQLQATLIDLIDLSLIGKQYHWNITGEHFRALHLMLDELVDSWRASSDTVAERVTALGVCPDGRAATIASDSELPETPSGPVKDVEVVAKLTDQLAQAVARLNERIARVGEIDPASEDVLIEIARTLEENHWMLAAQRL